MIIFSSMNDSKGTAMYTENIVIIQCPSQRFEFFSAYTAPINGNKYMTMNMAIERMKFIGIGN